MKTEIKDKQLILTLDLQTPVPSKKSGKTLIVASSHGNVPTDAMIEGKQLYVGVNAYIYK